MKTATEFLADLWREVAGLPSLPDPKNLPPIEVLRETEWSHEFEKAMRCRLVMGAFRYGLMAEQDYGKYDLSAEIHRRVNQYSQSRNLESLIDAANMCMLAYIHGRRTGEILFPIDDGQHSKERSKSPRR